MTGGLDARGRLRGIVTATPAALPLRELRIRRRQRKLGAPDWLELGAGDATWSDARRAAVGGPRVLIATMVGMHMPAAIVESALAVALSFRGAEVDVLLCDGSLPACFACEWDWFPGRATLDRLGPQRHLCPTCIASGRRPYDQLGLSVYTIGGLVEPVEIEEVTREVSRLGDEDLDGRELEGVAVGEHAMAGALRFLARGDFDGVPDASQIRRRYLTAAMITSTAVRRLLRRHEYEAVVTSHGIYVPQGLVVEAAKAEGVRVVTWEPAYRAGTVIFSHGDTYHRTLMDEPNRAWETMPWTEDEDRALERYLDERRTGATDQISFSRNAKVFDHAEIAGALGLDRHKPTIGVLTNVVWDAQIHYPANIYPTMMDWLVDTIERLGRRDDLQVVVRVHPAELYGYLRSRQLVVDELTRRIPVLPENTFVIRPDSPISTHAAMALCDTAIIYGTKMGVELAASGTPVIVAGEAWIRNKGIATEPQSREDYLALLDRSPIAPLDQRTVERARRYAYHYFFRRMVRLDELEAREGHPPYRLVAASLGSMAPPGSRGLDVLCRGILEGTPFTSSPSPAALVDR